MPQNKENADRFLERLKTLQHEAQDLAQDLLAELQRVPAAATVKEAAKRWEQIEAIVGALRVAQAVLLEEGAEETKQLARQLRRWRRLEGRNGNVGWIEIRMVNGYGPYVYYRFRHPEAATPAERKKIHTEYYGRLDSLAWLATALGEHGDGVHS